MTVSILAVIILLTALLGLSAFFSASETAFTSIGMTPTRLLKRERSKTARRVVRLLQNRSRLVTAILIGNNIVNIWASSLATALALPLFGEKAVYLSTTIMTILILLFSEITPKKIAAANPVRSAKTLSLPLAGFNRLVFPLTALMELLTAATGRLIAYILPPEGPAVSEEELRTLIRVGRKEGVLEEGEHNLLNRVFAFTDLRIREIMTPRTEICALPVDSGYAETVQQFRAHQYSRMPVYRESLDSICGMVHYKDILFARETAQSFSIESILRPVAFVPESKTAFGLLEELESRSLHMAIVVDEHGGTDGLITMDDAVAAVFGGIRDEFDTEQKSPLDSIRFIHRSRIEVPGELKLTDFNELLKASLHSDFYETIGGLILEACECLPSAGTECRLGRFIFRVVSVNRRRIHRLDVKIDE